MKGQRIRTIVFGCSSVVGSIKQKELQKVLGWKRCGVASCFWPLKQLSQNLPGFQVSDLLVCN